jgi:ABC-type methionine transport system ATPase subunit
MKKCVMLTPTQETLSEPIIYTLGQQFHVITNIHRAEVSEDRGWVIVELEGTETDIEQGIAWVISRGVRVDIIEDTSGS